jgi:ketosteroid isomerase-like protein
MTHHEHPNVTLVREGFEALQRGDTAWMDQHLADDVVWHVGGNSKWAGAYEGKAKVLEYFARQAQATSGPPLVDVHDILGNDDHVVALGTASATAGWVQRRVEVHPDLPHPGREGDRGLGNGRERRRRRPVPGQSAQLNTGEGAYIANHRRVVATSRRPGGWPPGSMLS